MTNTADTSEIAEAATVFSVPLQSELGAIVTDAARASGYGLRQYPSIDSLSESVGQSAVGCVILNVNNTDAGRDAITQLQSQFYALPIVIILDIASPQPAVELMRQGAFSVLSQPLEHKLIVRTLESAVERSLKQKHGVNLGRDAALRMTEATDKELEVLELVMAGRKNKEIATAIGITVRAVEDRRCRLMKKMQAESVAELVKLAVTAQLHSDGFLTHAAASAISPTEFESSLKGLEIWVPSTDSSELVLDQSVYRESISFREASEGITFRRGEGLPGQVWENRAPVFLKELINSDFRRRSAADAVGMTTAVGVPVFRNRKVAAVVVLLLDGRRSVTAAFESWRIDPQTEHLTLANGTYINCEKLRRLSEYIHLPLGEGLAGVAAERLRPYASTRFHQDTNAVRGTALAAENLTTAVALPLTDSGSLINDVFLLATGESAPVFSLIQVWKNSGNGLKLTAEIVDGIPTLASRLSRVDATSDSLQARCCAADTPLIAANGQSATVAHSSSASTPTFAIAIPTITRSETVAVTVLGNRATSREISHMQ